MRPAAVVAQVEQVVARHAVVLEVAGAVVVRRAAEHHRRPEVADAGVADRGVDDGGHPAAGALGAEPVLVVVAPDEELLARQADPLDQRAGDEHAVERDHDVADHAAGGRGRGRRACRGRRGCRPAAGSGRPAARGRPRRRRPGPRSRSRGAGARRGSPASGSPSSSISQTRSAPRSTATRSPSWNPPAPPRLRSSASGTSAGPSVTPSREPGAGQPGPGPVGRGVVDDDHLGQQRLVPQPRHQPLEQRPAG